MSKYEYVYTEKGEASAKALGFTDRKAGEVAMCGNKPVSGMTAQAWVAKGYIREVKNDENAT